MLSVSQAAQRLQVSEQWVRKLLRTSQLQGTRVGKTWVIEDDAVTQFAQQQMPLFTACTDTSSQQVLPATSTNDQQPANSADHQFLAMSFFSGAMGLDLGLEQAGINVVLACDSDKTCRATIHANRPNIPVIGDICSYNVQQLREIAGIRANDTIDLIVGGPPCQAFSTAGARKGFSDQRGNVFLYYIELLLQIQPRYIVLENVRGLLSASLLPASLTNDLPEPAKTLLSTKGGALLYIVERLRQGGYQVSFNLYNAANYGVPQIRERVVMLCNREGPKIPYLNPTNTSDNGFNLKPWHTLRDALKGLPHSPCAHLEFPPERLRFYKLLKEGQYWRNLPEDLQKEAMGKSYYLGGGKTGFYRRLAWDKPSCTLVTSPTMPATDICHPTENRPLSLQEYRRIQMFPDDWKLCGNLTAQYKQVGNAVPVGLGKVIGETILAHSKGQLTEPPRGFPFSRYKLTDDVSWEIATRKKLGLHDGELLSSRPEIQDAVRIAG